MSRIPRTVLVLLVSVALIGLPTPWAAHAVGLTSMDDPLYQRAQPGNDVSIVTPWIDEANAAGSQWGYTVDLGAPFRASTTAEAGLTAVHRLWNASTVDFVNALAGSDAYRSATASGYADQGASFYALAAPIAGTTEPVNTYTRNGKHRLATAATGSGLQAAGWVLEGVAFHMPSTASQEPGSPTAGSPGSGPVGSARYPVPAGAVFASPAGSDTNPGTLAAPVRTIGRALALAPSGGTVVVRQGVYRESLSWYKPLTLQNYPGEAVWLDGSTPVTGWVRSGAQWRKDGWTTRFDHSPTYTQGAPDNTEVDWQFVNPNTYPMAAHPDQVFIDGKAQQQVRTAAQVTPGTFYLDESTSRLYLGSDPTGRTVEASTRVKALSILGADSVVRGIGVRRYSPSVFHMGAVTVEKPRVRLENVIMEDAATTGISVLATGAVLDRVTVRGSGMLGIHARFADGVRFTRVLSTGNNDEHFNVAPVSGGAKIGHTRGVTIEQSSFSGNYGHGFWEDLSVFDTVVRSSRFTDNDATGLFLEISAKAVVGDNLFARNRQDGLRVNNTSDVKIWNNTFVGNGRPLNLVQDARRNVDPNDQAVDPRIPFPDPQMPWTLGPVTVGNNVVATPSATANCLLCVEDYSFTMTAEQMGIRANGNVYHRSSPSSPTWLAVWSRGSLNNRNPWVFQTLAQFRQATGQEATGREYVGAPILTGEGQLVASVAALAGEIAQPLPSDVAASIQRPAGSRTLGRW